MTQFEPRNPDFAARCRDSFRRQKAMALIGAEMGAIEAGFCRLELPYREELTQQHGFFHGGILTALADSAAGYAAFSLYGAEDSVMTVELKMNLMAPARGERLLAEARVTRSGRTLSVVEMDVFAQQAGGRTPVAKGLGTWICLAGRPDTPEVFSNGGRSPSLDRTSPREATGT